MVAVAAAVWVVAASMNQAQVTAPPGGTKVAVVDLVRVFNEFEQTEVLNQKMTEYRGQLSERVEGRMEKIEQQKKLLDAYTADTPEWYEQWKKYRKAMFDYRVWEMTEQDLITDSHRRWIKRTYQTVTDEIAKVARQRGYELVVTQEEINLDVRETKTLLQQLVNRKVVFADPKVDLTEEVLRNLNADFKKAGGADSIDFMPGN
jgi:Skp family chaperone for outer membrane proteins